MIDRVAVWLERHQPPWYGALERTLAPVGWAANAILLALVALTLLIVWRGPNWLRLLWLAYWISP
ncbi:MAG TPA: hypothetical protein VFD49_09125 [Candidatus Dormibacteraeota bacterium]|nr:hypothetical protein [Candidatus Dormibacteraeota bacterium]